MPPNRISTDLVPTSRSEGTAIVASLRGEIDLHNSGELRDAILSLLTPTPPPKLILNLTEVPYMDSSGIAVLVEALGRVRRAGGRVFLTNLQTRVKSILEIARLHTLFIVAPDEQTALATP
jgi:anti-sigma B factor antagonist